MNLRPLRERDLYRATAAVKLNLGFCGLVKITAPVKSPLIKSTKYERHILSGIPMGQFLVSLWTKLYSF